MTERIIFKTHGDDAIELINSSTPKCRDILIENSSAHPMTVEVQWVTDKGPGAVVEPTQKFELAPQNTIWLRCQIGRLRVLGPAGDQGNWQAVDKGENIDVRHHGRGVVFKTQAAHGECRKFKITNNNPDQQSSPATITFKRTPAGGGNDETVTVKVYPGNSTEIECEIYEISVTDPSDANVSVEGKAN